MDKNKKDIRISRFDKDAADGFNTVFGADTYFDSIKNPYTVVDFKSNKRTSLKYIGLEIGIGIVLLILAKYYFFSGNVPQKQVVKSERLTSEIEHPVTENTPILPQFKAPNRIVISTDAQDDSVDLTMNEVKTIDTISQLVVVDSIPLFSLTPTDPSKEMYQYPKGNSSNLIYIEELLMVNYKDSVSSNHNRPFVLTGLPAAYETYDQVPSQFEINQRENNRKTSTDAYLKKMVSPVKAFMQKNYDKALSGFLKINKENKNDVNTLFYAGLCYYYLGKQKTAILFFEKVLDNNQPTFYMDADWYIAMSYLELNQQEKASLLLTKIINSDSYYAKQAKEKLIEIKH